MALRYEPITTADGLHLLRHFYKFVNMDWQRLPRENLPDQGFEMLLRNSCITNLHGWRVSQEWELGLGSEMGTASGVRHEIDIVARCGELIAIAELKNKPGSPPDKNDVITFFAKILDYLAHNSKILLNEVVPVFISSSALEEATLAACLGLGIHPVAPGLRPLPLVAESLLRIEVELARGAVLSDRAAAQWDDACAGLNRLTFGLNETWMATRCGYISDDLINLRSTVDIESYEMGNALRKINSDCSAILDVMRSQKQAI